MITPQTSFRFGILCHRVIMPPFVIPLFFIIYHHFCYRSLTTFYSILLTTFSLSFLPPHPPPPSQPCYCRFLYYYFFNGLLSQMIWRKAGWTKGERGLGVEHTINRRDSLFFSVAPLLSMLPSSNWDVGSLHTRFILIDFTPGLLVRVWGKLRGGYVGMLTRTVWTSILCGLRVLMEQIIL